MASKVKSRSNALQLPRLILGGYTDYYSLHITIKSRDKTIKARNDTIEDYKDRMKDNYSKSIGRRNKIEDLEEEIER